MAWRCVICGGGGVAARRLRAGRLELGGWYVSASRPSWRTDRFEQPQRADQHVVAWPPKRSAPMAASDVMARAARRSWRNGWPACA